MRLTEDNKLKKLVVVGDRVLIKLKKANEKTSSGLYLPPGVQEKEKVQQGYIMKAGPGYPIPMHVEEDEPWKEKDENIRYVPLQAKEGPNGPFLSAKKLIPLDVGQKVDGQQHHDHLKPPRLINQGPSCRRAKIVFNKGGHRHGQSKRNQENQHEFAGDQQF